MSDSFDSTGFEDVVKWGPIQVSPMSWPRMMMYIIIPAIIIAVPAQIIQNHFHPWGEFQRPHIKAAPYIWPSGCEQKRYRQGSGYGSISSSCADKNYYIGDGKKWGWGNHLQRITPEFYRVGNDAIAIICNFSQCAPHYVYYDVFYQDESGNV